MSKNKKLIILSARDIAGAYSVLKFNKLLKKNFEIVIISQNPAYNILKTKLKKNLYKSNNFNLLNFLKTKMPYAIIGSLSSKNYGVDEILVKYAKTLKIKSFIYQDYPGDFNFKLKCHPDYYLVTDGHSKKLTYKLTKTKTIIIGYLNLKKLNFKLKYQKTFASCKKKIIFLGQPIYPLKSYFNTLKVFIESLHYLKNNYFFFYRPHPNEKNNFEKIKLLFLKKGINIKKINSKNIYDDLLNQDLLISCCSSAIVDYSYLKYSFGKNKLSSIYLMYDKKILSMFKDKIYVKKLVYEKIGFTKVARSSKDLIKYLKFFDKYSYLTEFDRKLFSRNKVLFRKFEKQLNMICR